MQEPPSPLSSPPRGYLSTCSPEPNAPLCLASAASVGDRQLLVRLPSVLGPSVSPEEPPSGSDFGTAGEERQVGRSPEEPMQTTGRPGSGPPWKGGPPVPAEGAMRRSFL